LRQHSESPTGLLVLRKGLPLALEDRKGRRMKRVANLETATQILSCLGLGYSAVHSGPLRRKLGATFKAPVCIFFADGFADPFAADLLKQAPAHHFADLGFIVGDEVFGHPAHHLRDLVLPLHIPVGHLDLAARQADNRRALYGSGGGHGQVLNKGMELIRHFAMAV